MVGGIGAIADWWPIKVSSGGSQSIHTTVKMISLLMFLLRQKAGGLLKFLLRPTGIQALPGIDTGGHELQQVRQ